jgi:hypothetical protein
MLGLEPVEVSVRPVLSELEISYLSPDTNINILLQFLQIYSTLSFIKDILE